MRMTRMTMNDPRQQIPSVDLILNSPPFLSLLKQYPRYLVLKTVRTITSEYRVRLPKNISITSIFIETKKRLKRFFSWKPQRVINATGILLHTGLGRAPICPSALESALDVARGYCNIQFSLENGRRAQRDLFLNKILSDFVGVEESLFVNNNAAAIMLTLNELAFGREVLVSRGELVSIGGSFRLPNIMEKSGVKLVEVGTTNRTTIEDYERAITENTAMIFRADPSNFKLTGYTYRPEVVELKQLAESYSLPLVEDLGAGTLIDMKQFGLPSSNTIHSSIKAGVDLLLSSGDKLIAGPQSGIIMGKKCYVDRLRKNSLFRAFRICKLTAAALSETLLLYMQPEKLLDDSPFYMALSKTAEALKIEAESLAKTIRNSTNFYVHTIDTSSYVGGGAFPDEILPTTAVAFIPSIPAEKFSEILRDFEPPIICRIEDNEIIIDPRSLLEGESEEIIEAILQISESL